MGVYDAAQLKHFDGEVGEEERTKESAEWANAFLRGVWPIMNPDLYVLTLCPTSFTILMTNIDSAGW